MHSRSSLQVLTALCSHSSATGHSSVLFTTEAQLNLVFHLIRPILAKLKQAPNAKPAPYVGVTPAAEDRFYADLRKEMKNRVWEKDGGVSWYVDKSTGLCTVRLPLSSFVHFIRGC